jgi:hypothetical protein
MWFWIWDWRRVDVGVGVDEDEEVEWEGEGERGVDGNGVWDVDGDEVLCRLLRRGGPRPGGKGKLKPRYWPIICACSCEWR